MRLNKLVFIGLDSAEYSLLKEWSEAGLLPAFQYLFKNSLWGKVSNPEGMLSSIALWPSLFTSKLPDEHGRHAFRQLKYKQYHTQPTWPDDLKFSPFWQHLSDQGHSVAILDVPGAPCAKNLNGIQIYSWGLHDADGKFKTYPPELEKNFKAKYGLDPVNDCDNQGKGQTDFNQFADLICQKVKTRMQFSKAIQGDRDWDVFFTVFSETHCVGHQAWHLIETTQKHDSNNPMLRVYSEIDKAIGELIENSSKETLTVVYSSQGMGPRYNGSHLLENILQRIDSRNNTTLNLNSYNTLFEIRKKIPAWVHGPFRGVKERLRNYLLSRDWRGKKCFPIAQSFSGASYIRLNIKGREPQGIINPGQQATELCNMLKKALTELVEPKTGKPLVKSIIQANQAYVRYQWDSLPDLIIIWNNQDKIEGAYSERLGLIEGVSNDCRTGDHLNEGVMFLHGSGVNQGQLTTSIPVCQVVPSIAYILKQELPSINCSPHEEILNRFSGLT